MIPLVFLPSLLCDEAMWQHQFSALKDIADCRAGDITRHDSIEALARDVLAEAPPQFALAGVSMGGFVALEIMRQAPEKVVKLCLLDTSAQPDTPELMERRQAQATMSTSGKFKELVSGMLPMLIHPDRVQDKELTDAVMAMASRVGP